MKSTYCPLDSTILNITVPDGFVQVFPELYECIVTHFSTSKKHWANMTEHIGDCGTIIGCQSKSGRYYLDPSYLTPDKLSFNYEPDVIPKDFKAYRDDPTLNHQDRFTSVKPDTDSNET